MPLHRLASDIHATIHPPTRSTAASQSVVDDGRMSEQHSNGLLLMTGGYLVAMFTGILILQALAPIAIH